MTAPVRTWLYAPGHHPERVRKALASGADAVVIDLEDAVPNDRKDEARDAALEVLSTLPSEHVPVWVRINPMGTPAAAADVIALRGSAAMGYRIPRAADARGIAEVASALDRPLHLILETAVGLLAAQELARAHELVRGMGLGEADLSADLRTASPGLDWARGWVVAVSRAAGLASPVQSVHTDVADEDGLIKSTKAGLDHGFFGRSIIHPRQIAPVHACYAPSLEAVDGAREILASADSASADGEVAALTPDGRFVDPAVVARARLTLDLADLDPKETR